MKIACQSCQAKYTIADEKVVGKVVKIRCKKCGSTIVVNGQESADGGAAPAEDPTEIRSGTGDFGTSGAEGEAWTVNVADDDQRTMTTHQIVAEFASGTITDETYCWRDGMGDWLPLREIEELATACGHNAASAFARQPEPQAPVQQAAAARNPSVRPQAAGTGGSSGALAGIFGSSPPGAMGAQMGSQGGLGGGAAAARRAGGRAGADLFGAAAEAGGENDVMTSAPQSGAAPRGGSHDDKMTGQRNENSVLFSLNSLTANEPKKAGGSDKLVGAAEGDGSGLIDIRALSSGMSSGGPKKANHADDIMNLGGGGAFSAALAAPVLTAPPIDAVDVSSTGAAGNKKLLIMFGALAAMLIGGMVVMFFLLQPKTPVAGTTPEGPGSPTGAGNAGTAATAAPTAPTATVAAAETAAPADTSPKAVAPAVGGGGRHTGGNSGGGGGGQPVAVAVAPVAPPPPPPAAERSLAQQMAAAGGGGGGGGAPSNPGPSAGSSAPFDRGQAAASLGAIADSVSSCKKPGGPTGDGHVSITFAPSGNVLSAIVDQPPYAGTAVGGCVAGKFRSAHVPAFAGGNMPVGKRFVIN